jgi:tetratricopeptide (TPR) repeat protein
MDTAVASSTRYRAFICYSHRDQRWARWLHNALESYRVPRRLVGETTAAGIVPARLSPIFRDREELPSASDLSEKINEALAQSANLIVICSPDAAKSRWVDAEIRAFKRLGRAQRIFCLIVAGGPDASDQPGRAAEECFAPALRFRFGSDGQPTRERVDPIAADARADKDGKSDAKLKLIAGILSLDFDVLKQREHHRRVRELMAVAAMALLFMLLTTGLAIDALIARKAAVTARDAAQRRQRQAEDLVGFMLGDLNDKLIQVRRLDILEATDAKAMKYFESLPTNDVTDDGLALRAKALEKIGRIRTEQGKLPEALVSYRAASALTRELSERAPADPGRRVAYANSFNWMGNAYWYQGDLDRALENFQQAIHALEQVAAGKPGDVELAFSLASARTNAGRVFEARGELPEAKKLYELVRQAFETLRLGEPQSPRWQIELGYAYDNLGKVALEQGQLVQAIAAYRYDQRIKAAVAAQDPKNYDAREELLIADAILGRTLALGGASKAAIDYVRDAVRLARELVAFDPTQALWREDLGDYSRLLGGMFRQSGRLDEATRLDDDAVREMRVLVATDNTNARWRRGLALAQVESARVQIARHDYAAAEEQIAAALTTIEAGQSASPNDVEQIRLVADVDIVAGQIAAKRKEASAARDHWIHARDGITAIAAMGDDPNVLAVRASALLLLNDLPAARPVLRKLAGMGYRGRDFEDLVATRKVPYAVDADVMQRISDESAMELHESLE